VTAVGGRLDRDAFKTAQRRGWSDAATGWRRWWHKLEADVVTERLLELAEVKLGERVLDVATGIGEPALTAALRVGSEGQVVATDISPEMLAIARERAAEQGLRNVEFVEADAEQLDFPEEHFDAVLSRFGLTFLPDGDDALRRVRRALVISGRFAASLWHERSPFFSTALTVTRRHLGLPEDEPTDRMGFALHDRSQAEALLGDAGFVEVRSEIIELATPFASPYEYVEYLRDTAVTINNLLTGQSLDRRSEVWKAISTAIAAEPRPAGPFVERVDALTVAGKRG
jgi:enediyne biosynthesis protein CalE5